MDNKVVLLSDSAILSEGMARIIGDMPDFQLVEHTNNFDIAQSAIIHNKANVIVMEPHIIDYSFRNNIRNAFKNIPSVYNLVMVAIVSHYTEQTVLSQFKGFVELTDSVKHIEDVLRQCIVPDIPDNVDDSLPNIPPNSIFAMNEELSDREIEVLVAVAKGLQNKEIAETLKISVHTVMSHRKNIIAKTGIKSIAGLTVYALMNGLIEESAIK